MVVSAGSYPNFSSDSPVLDPSPVSPEDVAANLSVGFLTARKVQSQNSLRFVMFPVGDLDLAIPIATVVKVVNLGTVKGSGQSPWGVTALGSQPYTVIDLHHYLFQTPLPPSAQGGYLVLISLTTGELVGIPTMCTPTLVEANWEQIRLLPDAYRKSDRLAVASHLIRWANPETQGDHFLFVLDVNALSDLTWRS